MIRFPDPDFAIASATDPGSRQPSVADPNPDKDQLVMRHRVSHRKLGRVTEHRIAMLRNQAHALLLHEHIETTVPKAKELRPFVERIITIGNRKFLA